MEKLEKKINPFIDNLIRVHKLAHKVDEAYRLGIVCCGPDGRDVSFYALKEKANSFLDLISKVCPIEKRFYTGMYIGKEPKYFFR